MSGETEKQVSGWTVDTLKDFYDQRMIDHEKAIEKAFIAQEKATASAFDASNKAIAAAFDASNKAIEKSDAAAEKRFESVNEFRQTLTDQTATFIPRAEADRVATSTAEKIQALTDRLNRMDGQGEGSKITMGKLGAALAAAGTVISIAVVVLNQYINSAYRATPQPTQAVIAQPTQEAVTEPKVIPLKK
jgi:hypothetical protein